MASALPLFAGTLDGVNLPDKVQAVGKTLILNGMGLRTKYMFKVYVAGLYLEQKSSDANAIIHGNQTKRIVLHFVHSASKKQIADAFDDAFSDNAPDAKKIMQPEIDRLFDTLEPVKPGDEMEFTYVPGEGTTYDLQGQQKNVIPGQGFADMFFSSWLGPKPPNAGLKKGLLGE